MLQIFNYQNQFSSGLWAKYITGTAMSGLASDSTHVIICGTVSGTPDLGMLYKFTTDGDLVWARTLAGTSSKPVSYYSVALDADGSIFVAGKSYGSSPYGGLMLVKYSESGTLLFKTEWAVAYSSLLLGVAVDSNNVFVTGSYYDSGSRGVVFKLTKNTGDELSRKSVIRQNTLEAMGYTHVSSNGSVVVYAGAHQHDYQSPATYTSIVSRFNASNMAETGHRFITGAANTRFELNGVVVLSNGDTIISGIHSYSSNNRTRVHVIMSLSSSLAVRWVRQGSAFNSSRPAYGCLTKDSGSNIYYGSYYDVSGNDTDPRGLVVKLDTNGNILFTKSLYIPGQSFTYVSNLNVQSDGIYAAVQSSIANRSWVAKLPLSESAGSPTVTPSGMVYNSITVPFGTTSPVLVTDQPVSYQLVPTGTVTKTVLSATSNVHTPPGGAIATYNNNFQ